MIKIVLCDNDSIYRKEIRAKVERYFSEMCSICLEEYSVEKLQEELV